MTKLVRRLVAPLVALFLLSSCTVAEVDQWFSDHGVDIELHEAQAITDWLNSQDCLPGYDRPQYTECAVADMAERFGIPKAWFARVAWCESRLDPRAENRYSSASGLYQFLDSTWASVARSTGHWDVYNARQAAYNAAWLWTTSGPHHWLCA